MQIDHIFIFTGVAADLSAAFRRFGLTEGTPNSHPGQGTACRRFFFHNAYIELVWVNNRAETQQAQIARMKLWERSQYRHTHYCPFGLCFRSSHSTVRSPILIFEDSWRYYSSFLPAGQFANIAANEHYPWEPLLFEMPFFGLAPKDYLPEKRQPLVHQKGFSNITKVQLTLPLAGHHLSSSMQQVIEQSAVVIIPGDHYAITIELDNGSQGASQLFEPLAPLTIIY